MTLVERYQSLLCDMTAALKAADAQLESQHKAITLAIEALTELVGSDGCYRDNDIIISRASHADAIATVRKARAALTHLKSLEG